MPTPGSSKGGNLSDNEATQLSCALIGPGAFGRSLARALCEDTRVRLAGVLGATAEESAAGAAELGGRGYATLEELLADGAIQAVLIATPSDTHAALAIAAAGAGKHVFVEKPMALTVAECDAMIAASERAGKLLMVGQMQRLAPLLAEVRRLAQSGAIGRVVAANTRRIEVLQRKPGSWLQRRAQVGGVLHQSTVHELDWLRTALGEASEVFAQPGPATIQDGLDFPDTFEISVRFQSGVVATHSACMTGYVHRHDGVLVGTRGAIGFDLVAGTLELRDQDRAGEAIQREEYRLSPGAGVAVRAELRGFVEAALSGGPAPIPGAEGRANIELIQAALIAAAERRPVALPLDAGQHARRAYLEV
jgi:predicted dehydrogenase